MQASIGDLFTIRTPHRLYAQSRNGTWWNLNRSADSDGIFTHALHEGALLHFLGHDQRGNYVFFHGASGRVLRSSTDLLFSYLSPLGQGHM